MYLIACISVCAGSLRGCRERFRRTPSTCVCQAAAASSTNDDAIAVSSADFRNVSLSAWSKKVSRSPVTDTLCLLCPPPDVGPGGASSNTAIRPSVCLYVPWRSCPRHAGCLQLSHRRRLPKMCGLRTRPRTDVDPPRVELPSAGGGILCRRLRGDNLLIKARSHSCDSTELNCIGNESAPTIQYWHSAGSLGWPYPMLKY